jgi:hypothetical protein
LKKYQLDAAALVGAVEQLADRALGIQEDELHVEPLAVADSDAKAEDL